MGASQVRQNQKVVVRRIPNFGIRQILNICLLQKDFSNLIRIPIPKIKKKIYHLIKGEKTNNLIQICPETYVLRSLL
jgi:hypothetical protein